MESLKELFRIGIGPSSSHTMGPFNAAQYIKNQYPLITNVKVVLYNSLALTGLGHLTYQAINQGLGEVQFSTKIDENLHPNHFEISGDVNSELIKYHFDSIGGGKLVINGDYKSSRSVYKLNLLTGIINYCNQEGINFYQYILEVEGSEIIDYLSECWLVMKKSIAEGLINDGVLPGKLKVKRKAKYLFNTVIPNESDDVKVKRIISSYAYAVSEQNAAGGLIVTAPTCGACGVLPAVLKYYQEYLNVSDELMIKALAVAGLIGNIVKTNASISGAEAGCQAEVGTACAMAAAAGAYLNGYSLKQIEYAAEMALEHHLGLTCDPIDGYVQIPCIERNAHGALRALDCASLSYLLYKDSKISFDMVVETMLQTGKDLHSDYRETALGGLAKLEIEDKDETKCW
jgi:L-serine dehydratase